MTISVVMPIYNCAEYLNAAIQSVLAQSYPDWQLVIIDDGSVDGSLAIARSYSRTDYRISVFQMTRNSGVGAALDYGMSLVTGDYIARMDGDDISLPLRFEKQVEFLEKHKDIVAVGSQVELIDGRSKSVGIKRFPLSHEAIERCMYLTIPMQHPTIMIRHSMIPKSFSWYDGWRLADDTHLLFKLLKLERLANMDCVLLRYRYMAGSVSLANPRQTFAATMRARRLAVEDGYVPTARQRTICVLQAILVAVLPDAAIRRIARISHNTEAQ